MKTAAAAGAGNGLRGLIHGFEPHEESPALLRHASWGAADLRHTAAGCSEPIRRVHSYDDGHGESPGGAAAAATYLRLLKSVNELQHDLALVSSNPLLGLQEAAELLTDHLGVDLAAIWVSTRDGPPASVLLAAHGVGSRELRQRIVVTTGRAAGDDAGGGLPAGGCRLGAPCRLSIPDASQNSGVPPELWSGPPQLRSFVQVPVGPRSEPRGTVLLAKKEPGAFATEWWHVRLHIAATGLLPHLRHAQVVETAALLRDLEGTEDVVAMIGSLLQSASAYVLKSCSLRSRARLALLQPDDPAEALLLETSLPSRSGGKAGGDPSAKAGIPGGAEAPGPAAAASAADNPGVAASIAGDSNPPSSQPLRPQPSVAASLLRLRGTLLACAVTRRQARFVSDVGRWLQSAARPASDLFTSASELVASIVVVPLVAGSDEEPLGGLYWALEVPCDFALLQETLLGFMQAVAPLLQVKLGGQTGPLAALVDRQNSAALLRRQQSTSSGSSDGGGGLMRLQSLEPLPQSRVVSSDGSSSNSALDAADGLAGGLQQPLGLTSSLVVRASSTSAGANTQAMLQLLQQDVRRRSARSVSRRGGVSEVTTGPILGRGGFGCVYEGTWHRSAVAVKVMPTSGGGGREAVQGASEMAMMSVLHHPFIVPVFACLTDMVEVVDTPGPARSYSGSAGSLASSVVSGRSGGACSGGASEGVTRYRRRTEGEVDEEGGAAFNIVIMELCDCGTLRDVVRSGKLHRQLPGGVIGVNLAAAVEVLLNVAYAVAYLHSMGLVHGDIKMENVMVKSDKTSKMGFACKLGDFGLARFLDQETDSAPSLATAAGTVTHLCPEMFRAHCRVTTAVDAYAFGILAWEVYTGQRAYAGLSRTTIITRVCRGELRPHFPSGAPPEFAALAQACWSQDPASRPSFGEHIVGALEAIAANLAASREASRKC